jgi:mono/diheme cytochrome c family protein
MSSIRRKSALLVTALVVSLSAAACGRASEEEINQLLGITPTATLSAESIATGTAASSATNAARTAVASSPGAVALGDVSSGARQFDTWCAGCHGPGGAGPDIRAPGGAGASITAASLAPLIREGEGHTPPGPYKTTEISDKQIVDIAAYLNVEAGG